MRRLYPPLLGALVGGVILAAVWPESAVSGGEAARHAMVAVAQLSSPWLASDRDLLEPFAVTWSLSIEWYFYMLWPFLIVRLRTVDPARAAQLLMLLGAVIYAVSLVQTGWWFYYGPLSRFAELTLCGALAFWLASGRIVRPAAANTVALLGVAFAAAWTLVGTDPYQLIYRAVALPAVVVAALALIAVGVLRAGWVRHAVPELAAAAVARPDQLQLVPVAHAAAGVDGCRVDGSVPCRGGRGRRCIHGGHDRLGVLVP